MDYHDFQAFLHIVHISDMHCRRTLGAPAPRTEQLARKFAQRMRGLNAAAGSAVDRLVDMGFGGHDAQAEQALRKFFKWFAAHPQYGAIPAWLLDTGDISAIGDRHSIRSAIRYLAIYRKLLNASASLTLYGNHDAWAETLPALSGRHKVARHREALRQHFFAPTWPQGPLSIAIPHTASRLQLFGLNSVIDDRWQNTFALGHVGWDPRWVKPASGTLHQRAAWENQVLQDPAAGRDFRVLALHHPVHYPLPRPTSSMHLRNDLEVGSALSWFSRKHRGKLASLVLSGHTHSTFPALGMLPDRTDRQWHDTLGVGQLQLIAGSATQAVSTHVRHMPAHDLVPQQIQVLTFFASPPGGKPRLVMERRIVGRPLGMPDFRFLPLPGTRSIVEATAFDY